MKRDLRIAAIAFYALAAGCGGSGDGDGTGSNAGAENSTSGGRATVASNEPTQDEMQQAGLRYAMGPESVIIGNDRIGLRGKEGRQQLLTIKKIACASSAEAAGANCDFNIETCVGQAPDWCLPESGVLSGRFVRGTDGWQYIPTNPMMAIPRPVDLLREMEMADMVGSGGIAGCYSTDIPERQQEVARRLGGEPCSEP